mmetsp:Transcript_13731/g.19685  ORF Transcript_13731/g.19685 Transcript_13731/m.19685 type:complete len:438 (-) Transcript_13731:60-1373(-)
MDRNTRAAYDLPTNWQSQTFMPVLRAEGCAVYIGNRKLTSHVYTSALEKWNDQDARDYIEKRHGISAMTFERIYWPSLRFALKKMSPHRRATAVKTIHRHLPTQEKLYKQGRVAMSSRCPRCLECGETNAHIYCCLNQDALKQRKEHWVELWKQLHKGRTATVIEQTWRFHLQPLLAIPLGNSIIDGLPIAHGAVADLLQQAIHEQTTIGWDKLLLGMGTILWKSLQDLIDSSNPKAPQRSAIDWMNSSTHQLLKSSIRCWKHRNQMVHGSTRAEQRQIKLQKVRKQITEIYENPPKLANNYRSIFEIPLAHRLKMPLQAAEHWVSMISHQIKVTQHNLKMLLCQHKPMPTHFHTMRREARQQAKDRLLPTTPRKAHRREVQAANKAMRLKLYAPKPKQDKPTRPNSKRTRTSLPISVSSTATPKSTPHPHPCQHPP